MNDIPRRTLNELIALYELEPKLRDVFVEGVFDKEVLSSCFRGTSQEDYIIYDINCVDIPSDVLIAHNLTSGNKQRVIALARELSNLPMDCSYRCLVDRDLDHWFGALEHTPKLVWTEHCSIELYFFTDAILREVLITVAKTQIRNWPKFFQSLINTLQDLYILRLADRDLGLSMNWLTPERCMKIINDQIEFDLTELVNRLLLKNTKSELKPQFNASIASWKLKLSGDHRSFIRGHDFIDLLAWSVRKFRGIKEFTSVVAIERIFVSIANKAPGLAEVLQ